MMAMNIPSMVVSNNDSSSNNVGSNIALFNKFNHLLNLNHNAGSVYSQNSVYSRVSNLDFSYARSVSEDNFS